jgi:RNA-directed DNA polymerase
VHQLLCQGFTDVVDADLSKYFDTIPHDELLRSVAARIVDRRVLRLIKSWLKTPIEETDPDGRRRMSGGKRSTCGTPQGGVISPLLANRYMNRFLRHWRHQERGKAFRAHVVNYADDFVILSRGYAEEALAWTRRIMTRLGLTVNEAKTTCATLGRSASTSWATASDRTTIGRMATGIWGRVRRRRACNASRGAWGRYSFPPTLRPGRRCATD